MRFSFSIERLIGETHSENRFHLNILSNIYIYVYIYIHIICTLYTFLFGIHTIHNIMRIVKHTCRIFGIIEYTHFCGSLVCVQCIYIYYPKRRYMFTVQKLDEKKMDCYRKFASRIVAVLR